MTIDEFAAQLRKTDQASLVETVRRSVSLSINAMIADVVRNKMSGQYLGVITGTARRSITGGVRATPQSVTGEFGSGLIYVRAHELGFRGTVAVKAHNRTSGTARVRPHQRVMNMRARRFLRDSLEQGIPGLDKRLRVALQYLITTGQVPDASLLGA